MRPRRTITFFLSSLRGGGAERVMVDLANELTSRGVPVQLLLLRSDGDVYSAAVEPGIPVRRLEFRGPTDAFIATLRYWRHMRDSPPATVFVSGHLPFLIAFLARFVIRHRIVVVTHNTVSRERKLSALVPRLLYRFADGMVAVSSGVASDLSAYGGIDRGRIKVIYNPVDLVRIDKGLRSRAPHEWLEHKTMPVILGVGSLTRQKRFDLLLRATAKLNSKRPVRLIILGEGPLRHKLEAMARSLGIADQVDLPGFTANPYGFMGSADVFALTSDFEGFALVVLEALACGCPVVATECPSGPSELLEGGRWGELVPPGDVDAIAAAIERTLDAPRDSGPLRRRAEEFGVARAAEAYLDSMDQTHGERRSRPRARVRSAGDLSVEGATVEGEL